MMPAQPAIAPKQAGFPAWYRNPLNGSRVYVKSASQVPAGYVPGDGVWVAPAKGSTVPAASTTTLTRAQVTAALAEAGVAFSATESLKSLTNKLEEAAKAAA